MQSKVRELKFFSTCALQSRCRAYLLSLKDRPGATRYVSIFRQLFSVFHSLRHLSYRKSPDAIKKKKRKKERKKEKEGYLSSFINVMTVLIPCPLGTCDTSRLRLIPLYFSMQIFSCLKESLNLAAN